MGFYHVGKIHCGTFCPCPAPPPLGSTAVSDPFSIWVFQRFVSWVILLEYDLSCGSYTTASQLFSLFRWRESSWIENSILLQVTSGKSKKEESSKGNLLLVTVSVL